MRSFLYDQEKLFILSLSCSLRLLLTLYAGLFVVLSLTKLSENARTSGCALKATKCTIKRLAFFNFDFCHVFSLPPLVDKELSKIDQKFSFTIIHLISPFVNSFTNFF